jgi:Ca2+-binding RTX toxin-like protein
MFSGLFNSYTLQDGVEKLTIGGGAGTGIGNGAANTLLGFSGDDHLYGLDGADSLSGGTGGNDFLYGGAGLDTLMGGAGADTFVLDGPGSVGSSDKIMDFTALQLDKLGIKGSDYGLTPGTALSASMFASNASGTATSGSGVGQFVYNSTTKKLYWDANGSDAGGQVEIANFATVVNLSAGDFVIL